MCIRDRLAPLSPGPHGPLRAGIALGPGGPPAPDVYKRQLMTRPVMGMRGGNWTFGAPSVLMTYHRTAGGLDRENEEMRECMPYFYQVTDGHGNGAEPVSYTHLDVYKRQHLV